MRSVRLASVVGSVLVGVALGSPVHADTLFFANGSFLTGEVQGTELSVVTGDGAAKVGLRDLQEVTLDTVAGDVVRDKRGRATTGIVDQSTYAIRLASGQTVVLPRGQVSSIRFTAR